MPNGGFFSMLLNRDTLRGKDGGEGGIRTHDTLTGMPVFKTGAINHSATSPAFLV